MRRSILTVFLLVALSFGLGGCSSFSKEGRQQRAYEKYVRKSSLGRAKQQRQMRPKKTEMPAQPMPSDPVETTETGETVPQTMPAEGS